jgi:hypothetical protein
MIKEAIVENDIVQTYCSFCGVGTLANKDDARPLCKDCRED